MRYWETKSGARIYHILKGRSNVYLIKTATQNLLVDTGKCNKRIYLSKKLEAFGIHKIDWLILTHTHFDHCQNAEWLEKNFQAKIVVSQKAREWIPSGKTPLPKGRRLASKLLIFTANHFKPKQVQFKPFNVYKYVGNKEVLQDQDTDLELLICPGHSEDSLVFILDNEIAFVGDTMFGIFKNKIQPPFVDNQELLIKQWKKLADGPCSLFLPGHGKPITQNLVNSTLRKIS